jgi:uncharacterized protein (UPF0332 family)
MKRDLVLAEWHRAQEAMRAADLLTKEKCSADAISRTYYAVLHAAKAALFVHDMAADSHRAVRQMFGLHLIRSGEIEKPWSIHLSKGLDERLAADYDAETEFSVREAREACRLTRQFVRRIRKYLISKGLAPSQLRTRKRG